MGQKLANHSTARKNGPFMPLRAVPKPYSQLELVWAYRILQAALALLLAGAGADKLFQVSLSWNQYLPSVLPWMLGMDPSNFLSGIGVFELLLAFGIVIAPAYVGAVTSLWLIVANLALIGEGNFHDLSLMDLALSISAFALSSVARIPNIGTFHERTLTIAKRMRSRLVELSYPRSHANP